MRLSKEEWFMSIAETVMLRWTCKRKQVWAVIVKDWIIISTWYNWVARWEKHCDEQWCSLDESCKFSLHAEENAIINCSRLWVSTLWCEMYVTTKPCSMCSRRLINAWFSKVFYKDEYTTLVPNIVLSNYLQVVKLWEK